MRIFAEFCRNYNIQAQSDNLDGKNIVPGQYFFWNPALTPPHWDGAEAESLLQLNFKAKGLPVLDKTPKFMMFECYS